MKALSWRGVCFVTITVGLLALLLGYDLTWRLAVLVIATAVATEAAMQFENRKR